MMNNPYDLHSWSIQYRQERLAEASRRRLVERAKASRELRRANLLGLVWRDPLVLLRRA